MLSSGAHIVLHHTTVFSLGIIREYATPRYDSVQRALVSKHDVLYFEDDSVIARCLYH